MKITSYIGEMQSFSHQQLISLYVLLHNTHVYKQVRKFDLFQSYDNPIYEGKYEMCQTEKCHSWVISNYEKTGI